MNGKMASGALLLISWATTAAAQLVLQSGQYGVGLEYFDALPDSPTELRTVVWYPTIPGAEGNSAVYSWGDWIHASGDWRYESPFLGVTDSHELPSDERFPLVVLSHGLEAWGGQFAYLGESLASHGYVVAAPYHNTNDLGARANELLDVVDTMLARSESAQDKLQGRIDPESIAIGGYSHGAATTSTALRQDATGVDAVLLIDGAGAGWDFNVDIPILHVGGGDFLYTQAIPRITSPEFYAIDIGRGSDDVQAHHWSFGLSGCQIRENVLAAGLAAGATEQEILDSVKPDSFWLGCNSAYIPPTEVQARLNAYAVGFLDSALKSNDEYEELLSPGVATTDSNLWLSVSLDFSSSRRGLAVLLTDPAGRSFGLNASTGEAVDDFGGLTLGYANRARSRLDFGLAAEALMPGEYVLTAVGSNLDAAHEYKIRLGSAFERGEDIVFSQSLAATGTVEPNSAIEPFHFTLSVSEVISIDELLSAIQDQDLNIKYDLNLDGSLDEKDIDHWVRYIGNTYLGDSNLDGEFNSSDMVQVLVAGKYETDGAASWAEGDWNGSGFFDSSDMAAAFAGGGYEKGLRTDAVAVPEPAGALLLIFGFLFTVGRKPTVQSRV